MMLGKRYYDFGALLALVGGFVFVAAQRIGTVPVPDDGDESMLLQIPYEILYRGKFAWPMCRYLGGNIENVWHSFRPALFLMQAGFFKLFGWGLTQGRVFNLIAAALTLVMVYLVGRRLFGSRAGLVAVIMLISDQIFFERSRMVRYEHPADVFALLAFYLYGIAEERRSDRLYVASGLAAGWAVMVHPNMLYILAAVLALMVLRHRARLFVSKPLYLFGGAAFLVMAYEIISGLVDYKNVRLQYHDDPAHFPISSPLSLWNNLLLESRRYASWYQGGQLISADRPLLLHVFQLLTLVSIVYLTIVFIAKIRSRGAADDSRVCVLLTTGIAALFFALATGHRRKYAIYMSNLTPWFALCVGILVRDALDFFQSLRSKAWPMSAVIRRVALIAVIASAACYGLLFVRQNYRYYKVINSPDHASFQEFTAVLRSLVPEGTCPISIVRPVIWLAFPESDQCYATLEGRMGEPPDIATNEYSLITASKRNPDWAPNPDVSYHRLGDMDGTPYGDIKVYYTGSNPEVMKIQPRRYQFFGNKGGYVEDGPYPPKP